MWVLGTLCLSPKRNLYEHHKYQINIREFSNHVNCHVKNNAETRCSDGAI